jgi:hypothetical protein
VAGARIEDFTGVLRYLRGLGAPCEPPVGVGSFLLLYASEREVVVWYSPAKENHREGEVTIPCARIARAWEALIAGAPLDEPALEEYGEGPGGGRWLLALLAQIPGIAVRLEPLALAWSPEAALAPEPDAPPTLETPSRKPRKRARSRRAAAVPANAADERSA